MQSVKRWILPLAAVGLIVWPVACGKKSSDVVATVGDYKVTVEELNNLYPSLTRMFAGAAAEYEARKEALDSLVVSRLLVQAAYQKKIDQVEEISRVVLANKDKFLLDALYNKEVVDKATAGDAEIKEYYNHLEFKLRASQIVVASEDTAKMVFEKVKAGENFEQLAYDHSIDPSAKRNRGDLGYFLWGAMVEEFQAAAFKMQPGEVSPPVKSRFGWHIIKVIEKIPNEARGSFDQVKDQIKNQIVNRKRNELTQSYIESIRAKYPVKIDKAICDYLLKKRENMYPPQLLPNLPKNDFDDTQLDRNEKDMVLATWDGGQMTLAEYLTQARQIPEQYKPNFDQYDSLASTVFNLKMQELLAYEANKAGLENDPAFQRKLTLFKEMAMADVMRSDSIKAAVQPDDASARKYYDEHPDEFSNPARMRLFEIQLSDELLAAKLAKQINGVKDLRAKAADLTERPGMRAASGDMGYIERTMAPELFDAAWDKAMGAIGGPVAAAGKYSIFYVADKLQPELKDFLGVKRDIILKQAADFKKEAFDTWLAEAKAATKIEINDEAIRASIDSAKYASVDTTATK
ncbi:MAG: peptidylprolyl isomerase [candidate division Zixibacteria bacterium]|nr:peptidylprolyl isomerase [candidate division Zixibacteria bacterium]